MTSKIKFTTAGGFFIFLVFLLASCKKDGNPNNLPDVSPSDYAGKIQGYDSSDQIFTNNLIAYWSFDNDEAERKSGIAPTEKAGDALVADGVRGKALSLTNGYLYYARQFPQFATSALTSWSISVWVKISNNGSKRTMLFQLARPGMLTGDINFILNTNAATTVNTLTIQSTFTTVGGGTQDNLNNNIKPETSMSKWTHLVLTYNGSTGVFDIWANGVKVGGFPNRGTGNNLFKSWEPNEVIIGANYNGIPGKSVNTDASFAPMTGQIDELRIYNTPLPDAHIKALYELGQANK